MANKCWWIFKDAGKIVRYANGSARIYPTKAAAKEDLKQIIGGSKESSAAPSPTEDGNRVI